MKSLRFYGGFSLCIFSHRITFHLKLYTLYVQELILLRTLFLIFAMFFPYTGVFAEAPLANSPTRPIVKIGVVGPLSGPAADYGIKQLRGVILAAEEVNRDGYLPWALEIVPADDKGKSSTVGEIARDLIFEDGVAAFIGCVNSACTHVLEMICVKAQKPQITTVSTDPSITLAGTPWIFRCLADDRKQAKAIVGYIGNQPGVQRVALLSLDNRYGKMGSDTCRRLLTEKGFQIVFEHTFPKGKMDRRAIAVHMMRASPQLIVLWSLYDEASQVIKALRNHGCDLPVIAPDGVTTKAFIELSGEACEGMVVTMPFNEYRDSQKTRTFLRQYRHRWNEDADSFAAHAYDGLKLMALALKKGSPEAFSLRDTLAETSNFEGVTGIISFDSTGNDTREVELGRIIDGRFVPLMRQK